MSLDLLAEVLLRHLPLEVARPAEGRKFEFEAHIDPERDRGKLDRKGQPRHRSGNPSDLPVVDVSSLGKREQRLARELRQALLFLKIARAEGEAFHAPDRDPEEFFTQALRAARIPLAQSQLQTPARERADRRHQAVDIYWPLALKDVTLTQVEALMAELEVRSVRGRVIELDMRRKDAEGAKWNVDLQFGYRVAARR
jgi:hypothetical protein